MKPTAALACGTMALAFAWSWVAVAQVPAAVNAADLPEGPARSAVAEVCGACHPLGQALGKRQSRAEWAATVEQMVSRGAPLAPEEFESVVDYLTAWYGTAG